MRAFVRELVRPNDETPEAFDADIQDAPPMVRLALKAFRHHPRTVVQNESARVSEAKRRHELTPIGRTIEDVSVTFRRMAQFSEDAQKELASDMNEPRYAGTQTPNVSLTADLRNHPALHTVQDFVASALPPSSPVFPEMITRVGFYMPEYAKDSPETAEFVYMAGFNGTQQIGNAFYLGRSKVGDGSPIELSEEQFLHIEQAASAVRERAEELAWAN